MANILVYLKNLFSSEKKPATEASLVGQLDAFTIDELKFMMKNSKGFLPISLETNLGLCSRIYDDELYHSSTSKSSGLWLAGVFRDKEGQKVFDLPIEDIDAETQKAVMTATREAFVDAQKQKIIEGGLRVFGDPHYQWDSLLSENNLTKENYRGLPAICRDLESLAKIKDIKNYSAKFSVLKSLKGEFAGQYVLTGKYNHLPLRSNYSVSDEFIYAFNKDNPSDRKLLNNYLNAKRQGNFKDADATKLAVLELYYKNIEAKTKERVSGIVTDGAGMVSREVNDFNRHHERQYMSAHQIPYMTVEYGVPTWHGDLDMTAYEHSSIKTLPENLHITGSLILTNADKNCSLTALPDGLKADGGIKAPKEYLESLESRDIQKKADRLNDQLVEDATKELNARLNIDGKQAVISTPEKIFPTSVTVGEYKNGKISYRDVVAVAATVKDGKVLFYESEKDAKNARNPHFFDALSLNDKKQLLGVLVDSKVSDDIRISARESYILHEEDFKRSFEQYKKSEERNQGKGVHR